LVPILKYVIDVKNVKLGSGERKGRRGKEQRKEEKEQERK
jgi:hypothetical protein